MMRGLVAFATLTAILASGPAAAHLVSTRFGELYSGMLHPVTTLQHLVPWLALALLAAVQDARTARWALLAFPVSVYAGVALGDLGPGSVYVDRLNLLSFVLLGLLVTLKVRLALPLFVAVVLLFGLSHGYANASPELRGSAAFLYASGVALVSYLLVTLVSASAHALVNNHDWGKIAVRAVGSWIAAAGLVYGGLVLTVS